MDDHFPLPAGVDPERDSTIHGPRSAAGMSLRRSQSLYSPGPDLRGSRRSGVGDDVLDIEVRVCVYHVVCLFAHTLSLGARSKGGKSSKESRSQEFTRVPKRIILLCICIVCNNVTREATPLKERRSDGNVGAKHTDPKREPLSRSHGFRS